MSAEKVRARGSRVYKSVKRNTSQIIHSNRARRMNARARRTMVDAKEGAKRIIGSQEVRGKGNEMMGSAKAFLGAVYDASHKEKPQKTTRRIQNPPKNRNKSRKP